MKSKLRFDLDAENKPVILTEILISDDVRDKIAKRFIEGFQQSGKLAEIVFHPLEQGTAIVMQIYPYGGDEYECKRLCRNVSDYQLEFLIEAAKNELKDRKERRKTEE